MARPISGSRAASKLTYRLSESRDRYWDHAETIAALRLGRHAQPLVKPLSGETENIAQPILRSRNEWLRKSDADASSENVTLRNPTLAKLNELSHGPSGCATWQIKCVRLDYLLHAPVSTWPLRA